MVHVKFCGLTRLEDALAAVELGADLLGFNFYPPSPRCIAAPDCARLVADLVSAIGERASQITLVGIFVNHTPDQVISMMEQCGLAAAQLSGDEPPEDLQQICPRAYKALRPGKGADISLAVQPYLARTQPPAFLLDAHVPGEYGGTGQVGDWQAARQAASVYPVLLAGGLNPANVGAAILQTRPWGVDVASGIEARPGVKDYRLMEEFMRAVRAAEDAIK